MKYIKLLRVKHYLKNCIIFIPLFFSKGLFLSPYTQFFQGCLGFLSFCFMSSAVYILNDLRDVKQDRLHPTKCFRAIASGAVSTSSAQIIMLLCVILSMTAVLFTGNLFAALLLLFYLALNVMYSMGLKNIPLLDVIILTSGFVIRIIFGALITNVHVSEWLYLMVFTGSFYMSLGKRRNELNRTTEHETRKVLKYYSFAFLDKNMYVCCTLIITFYSLWSIEQGPNMIWTSPLVMIILMRYSLKVEGASDGDPMEVILHDKVLLGLLSIYILCITSLLYII